jgi:HK97 family phage portal protein
MNWRDLFGGSDFKAVSIAPPPAVDRAALLPTHLDIPANLPPDWPGPAHAEIFWPNWPDEWTQVWFDRGAAYERSSLVMSAVNWLRRQLCDAPPKLEHLEGEVWVTVPDHPYLDILDAPNPEMSGEDLFKDFAYWWITNGNVYWYKQRDRAGRLLALFPLASDQVRPYTQPGSGDFITYYECDVDENRAVLAPRRVPPSDMIHFRFALDPHDRRVSINPLAAVTAELLADEQAILYQSAIMKNFGVPPFLVSPKPEASGSYNLKAEEMKREVMQSQQGSRRGTPMVFNRPVDLTAFGFSPDQMSVDKSRRLPEERVAAVLGIPGLVLQFGSFLDRATYSNMESAIQLAWNGFVIPTYRDISSTFRRSLMPEYVLDPMDWWPGFDYAASPAMAEDIDALYQRNTLAYDKGWLKRGEARAAAGLEVSEAEDDIYKAAPSGGGFGFGSSSEGERKQFLLDSPWDDPEIAEYYRRLAPPEYSSLITARERQ